MKIIWFGIAVCYVLGLYHMFFSVELWGWGFLMVALVLSYIGVIVSMNKTARLFRETRHALQDFSDKLSKR